MDIFALMSACPGCKDALDSAPKVVWRRVGYADAAEFEKVIKPLLEKK